MDYWLAMMTEENFRRCEERGLYGAPKKGAEFAASHIKKGDRLVVYVVKEGCSELCQSFVAVWEVAGGWRPSKKPIWPDEEREGRVKYPKVVEIKPVARGVLRLTDAARELEKFDISQRSLRLYSFYYRRRPIPRELGEYVERALGGGRPSAARHESLKQALVELADLLGYYGRSEVENGPFRHDVCWWKSAAEAQHGMPPVAVFEVVAGGSVERSLAALKHANDVWRPRGLFLVAADEEKRERAERLLEPYLAGAFHELAGKVEILTSLEVKRLYDSLAKHRDLLKRFVSLRL
ncbi:MAG: EVE domain-containing protein [Thermoproteus sp.]